MRKVGLFIGLSVLFAWGCEKNEPTVFVERLPSALDNSITTFPGKHNPCSSFSFTTDATEMVVGVSATFDYYREIRLDINGIFCQYLDFSTVTSRHVDMPAGSKTV